MASSLARNLMAAAIALMVLGMGTAIAWAYAFHIGPVVAEKVCFLGLFSGAGPIQKASARMLRNYPTRNTALALVFFINKNAATDAALAKATEADLDVLEDATVTLCLISGESFGTYFRKDTNGFTWGSIERRQWPGVVMQVNLWAVGVFGAELFTSMESGPQGVAQT